MIPKDMLGRYELSDGSSNKFWSIERTASGDYAATWGRIGTAGQGPKIYSEGEAYAKISEKISKGYSRVGGTVTRKMAEAKEPKRPAFDFLGELKKVK